MLSIPAAGFLVRLFVIQHDCGHGSMFGHRATNDAVGRILGVLTFTPYDSWRRSHALHHAASGDLGRRGIGDIHTLTVAEYQSRTAWERGVYRVYRHPLVMFGIGPILLFVVGQRVPLGFLRDGWRHWSSVMATNVAIVAVVAAMMYAVGVGTFLLVHLPIAVLASSAGVWLFYVQHQFEETSWEREPDWAFHEAALHGSSHYHLPAILRWFTGNIGVHHVHHLSSRVPYYRLPEVMLDYPELQHINRLTIGESLKCVPLVLWDEHRCRMVSFRDARASAGSA